MPRVGPLRYGGFCPLLELRSIPFTNLEMSAGWITACLPESVSLSANPAADLAVEYLVFRQSSE